MDRRERDRDEYRRDRERDWRDGEKRYGEGDGYRSYDNGKSNYRPWAGKKWVDYGEYDKMKMEIEDLRKKEDQRKKEEKTVKKKEEKRKLIEELKAVVSSEIGESSEKNRRKRDREEEVSLNARDLEDQITKIVTSVLSKQLNQLHSTPQRQRVTPKKQNKSPVKVLKPGPAMLSEAEDDDEDDGEDRRVMTSMESEDEEVKEKMNEIMSGLQGRGWKKKLQEMCREEGLEYPDGNSKSGTVRKLAEKILLK